MRRLTAAAAFVVVLSRLAAADGLGPVGAPLPPPPVPIYVGPPPIQLYTWNGPYVGGHIGGGWSDSEVSDTSAFLGGAQVGFNVRAGRTVFGLEGQWTGSGGSGDDTLVTVADGVSGTFGAEIDWIATLTGRVGIAWDRSLLYVKGGGAWASTSYRAALDTGLDFEGDETRSGWAAGVGYEFGLRNAWSARIEYLFMDFGSDTVALHGPSGALAVADVDHRLHAVTLSINYRFDWPAGPLGTPE